MEVLNTYQLVLPPLYGRDTFDSKEIKQAAKFVAAYILIIAFLAGAITSSPLPMILPGVAILLVYYFYMYETGKRLETTVITEESE